MKIFTNKNPVRNKHEQTKRENRDIFAKESTIYNQL